MTTIPDLEREIAAVSAQIAPLTERLSALRRQLDKAKSLAWIEANQVCRADVQMSSGDFWCVTNFADWILKNTRKRFLEWNGSIYYTAEIAAGRMDPKAPGRVEDLGK